MQPVSLNFADGIAHLVIDNPPVNALDQRLRAGLEQAIAQIGQAPGLRAVVLSCAGRTFVAGADIRELGAPVAPYLPDVLAAIEASPVPWIAALHGSVLGGGLELAMACHARIAVPGTRLGLPEVNLGIIPGSGGTVRLPRLVAMTDAIALATSGKPISAGRAQAIGLIDRIAESDLLAEAAGLLPQARRSMDLQVRGLDGVDWQAADQAVRRQARGAAAPIEALAALRDAAALPAHEAMVRERDRFLRLAVSDESMALRYIFFAEREAGRSLRQGAAAPAGLGRVGVVGGGTMGAGIAAALLIAGSSVRLIERDQAAAQLARNRVTDLLQVSLKRGALRDPDAINRLTTGVEYADLTDCPLVIEAVFEDLDIKRALFRQLDAVMPRDAILATNTSYLDVDALARTTHDPSRILGLHFFSPAHVMKLLEVVRGAETGPRSLATAAALARHLGKTAVVSGVCDGFIGNRIMNAYRTDCEFMLEEGALPEQIDRAMESFGFAMGIFAVQDMSGLDIAWAARKARDATRPAGQRYARIADRLCEAGRLGRKTGRGWYDYSSGSATPDPEVARIIDEESRRAGRRRREFTQADIMARILSVMQAEGRAILREGIAESASDIDVVMVTGYGFPRHKGGPMYLAQH